MSNRQSFQQHAAKIIPEVFPIPHRPGTKPKNDISFLSKHLFCETQDGTLAVAPFAEDAYSGGPVGWGAQNYLKDFRGEPPSIKIVVFPFTLGCVESRRQCAHFFLLAQQGPRR